jgi:3-oxoacyl-[acyl-carrier-protein] synthase II
VTPVAAHDQNARDHAGRWRVAITGMGVKAPAGLDLKTFQDTMLSGISMASPITKFETSALPVTFACQVTDFDPLAYTTAKTARRMDRVAQLGFAAAMDAIADAGPLRPAPDRSGVIFGTGTGGHKSLADQAVICMTAGPDRVSPLVTPMLMPNATSAWIAMELGWTGPNLAIGSACASGTNAIGEGARLIRGGDCDIVLAGGAEHSVNIIAMAAFSRTGALSARNDDPRHASRPFDARRDGYVMAEGAAFVILERLDLALRRGARIHGLVLGYGLNCDAHHLTAPQPKGERAAECINKALADAGCAPRDIGHVNAHGTSTRLNDSMETKALCASFPDGPPPVTGPKGVLGHMMGGSGAAEAVSAVLSASSGLVPPTANYEFRDPECDLDVVYGKPRKISRKPVLSNSFGFGGHNACLVLAPYPIPVPGI